jgi:periplasmic divalent cation tolerance protein
VKAVTDRIKALHSYDCPCVLAFDVAGGNDDFLDWIHKEVE